VDCVPTQNLQHGQNVKSGLKTRFALNLKSAAISKSHAEKKSTLKLTDARKVLPGKILFLCFVPFFPRFLFQRSAYSGKAQKRRRSAETVSFSSSPTTRGQSVGCSRLRRIRKLGEGIWGGLKEPWNFQSADRPNISTRR
jgi:hypothetical protein